jgi:hypothetical protein
MFSGRWLFGEDETGVVGWGMATLREVKPTATLSHRYKLHLATGMSRTRLSEFAISQIAVDYYFSESEIVALNAVETI